jgi:hypothetical protein
MKPIRTGLLGLAALLLAGCIVTSVFPFYTAKDLAFEPGLLGQWQDVKDENNHWHFARSGTNAYRITFTSGQDTNQIQGHFFKLDGQAFMDLFGTEGSCDAFPPPIPSHMVLRVLQVTPTVRMAALDHDWLKKYLAENPKAIRHHLVQSDEKSDDVQVVLTAETPELQKFVLGLLKTPAAWQEATELKRVTAETKTSTESQR